MPASKKQVAHEKKRKKLKHQKFYSKIRFFEKTKLTRQLNKVRKQLATTIKGSEQEKILRDQLTKVQANLSYVVDFPNDKKYVALFPSRGAKKKDGELDGDASDDEEGDEHEGDLEETEKEPPLIASTSSKKRQKRE